MIISLVSTHGLGELTSTQHGWFALRQRSDKIRKVSCQLGILLGIIGLAGCRSDAHTDLYVEQMGAEIRALEDQLYAASDENRKLRRKLERSGLDGYHSSRDSADIGHSYPQPISPKPEYQGNTSNSSSTDPRSRATTPSSGAGASDAGTRGPLKSTPPPEPSPSKLGAPASPPPARLETPPINPNDVRPGTITPPKMDLLPSGPASPPSILPPTNTTDKVKLPGSVEKLLDEPTGEVEVIRIDAAQTKPIKEQDRSGVQVVFLTFDNDDRRTIPTGDVEVAAVDPGGEGVAPFRLGHWRISNDDVKRSMSTDKVVRLKVFWDGAAPEGRAVKFFVRVRRENGEFPLAEHFVDFRHDALNDNWTPRTATGNLKPVPKSH
jgi:hypothetical protein